LVAFSPQNEVVPPAMKAVERTIAGHGSTLELACANHAGSGHRHQSADTVACRIKRDTT
jgi:hypothetical protein